MELNKNIVYTSLKVYGTPNAQEVVVKGSKEKAPQRTLSTSVINVELDGFTDGFKYIGLKESKIFDKRMIFLYHKKIGNFGVPYNFFLNELLPNITIENGEIKDKLIFDRKKNLVNEKLYLELEKEYNEKIENIIKREKQNLNIKPKYILPFVAYQTKIDFDYDFINVFIGIDKNNQYIFLCGRLPNKFNNYGILKILKTSPSNLYFTKKSIMIEEPYFEDVRGFYTSRFKNFIKKQNNIIYNNWKDIIENLNKNFENDIEIDREKTSKLILKNLKTLKKDIEKMDDKEKFNYIKYLKESLKILNQDFIKDILNLEDNINISL